MKNKILPIDYLKSALSVNTFIGCPLGCKYCVIGKITDRRLKRISSPNGVVKKLIKYKFFIQNLTPIVINNKTDPFLPEVKNDTFRILELLQSKNLKNPRIIISKLPIYKKDLEFLEKLNAPIFFIFSYSNIFSPVEKINPNFIKISLKTLKERKKVYSLHYWRPFIRGLNDSDKNILEVLKKVKASSDGSTISGLRIVGDVKKDLESCGAKLDDWKGDQNHKHFPLDLQKKILSLREKVSRDYPLYTHTSCGINACLNRRDWGFNFLKGFPHCIGGCKNKKNCFITAPSKDFIRKILNLVNPSFTYSLKRDHVFINQEIRQDEKAFILHSLNFPIKAKKINKSFSEKLILGEKDD